MSTEEIRSIREALIRIESALVGDPDMGHKGIVATQREHSKRIARLERVGTYITAAAMILVGLYKIAVDWFPKL